MNGPRALYEIDLAPYASDVLSLANQLGKLAPLMMVIQVRRPMRIARWVWRAEFGGKSFLEER